MNIELNKEEKLLIISSIKDRLSYLEKEDESFSRVFQYSFLDWAENYNNIETKAIIKHLDSLKSVLKKLDYYKEKKHVFFEDYIKAIEKFKSCKKFVFSGDPDNYYKIRLLTKDLESFVIELSVCDKIKLLEPWDSSYKKRHEAEMKNDCVFEMNKKEAKLAILKNKNKYVKKDVKKFLEIILK